MKTPPRQPADLFRTFADTTRLRILNLLLEGELCVCDLSAILGEIQPKVSRHLATLRRAELVRVRREGKRKFYSLGEDPSPLHQTLIRCVGSCLSELEVLRRDRRRLASMETRLHRASDSDSAMAGSSALPERGASPGEKLMVADALSAGHEREGKRLGLFERWLSLWVALCIVAGIALGKIAPGVASSLDAITLDVGGAPVVSIPIAVCLFFMMYPIMVKIDFAEVVKAGRSLKPVGLTLFINWAIKPFTMYAIALLFLGVLFRGLIGTESLDLVKMPLGLDLEVGASYGAGTVILHDGIKMLEVPLWRSYLAGCILLGIAPCTAMVLVWSFLARGNDGHTLVMVAINSLTMLVLYGVLGGFLLGVGKLPIPWEALALSIGIYVALPLVTGYLSRRWIIRRKGEPWFRERFLHILTPITIVALLVTLVLLFSFKGEVILSNPFTILWIAVPLFLQTVLIFGLGYWLSKLLRLSYADAAPTAMIGASNHFEVAIATSVTLFGLSSGAALATVVGVLIEVPLMLMLVRICLRSQGWFTASEGNS